MKKFIWIALAVLLIGAAVGVPYGMYQNGYRVMTDGEKPELTRDFNPDNFLKRYEGGSFTFNEGEKSIICPLEELGVSVIIDNPEVFDTPLVSAQSVRFALKDTGLKEKVQSFGENRTDVVLPTLSWDPKKGLSCVPGEQGNHIDTDALFSDVEEACSKYLEDSDAEISFDLTKYYIHDDRVETLEQEYQKEVDIYENAGVHYVNGYAITLADYKEYLIYKDGSVWLDEDEERLAELEQKLYGRIYNELTDFDTVEGDWAFTTASGQKITVSGGTWGDIYDSKKETAHVLEVLKARRIEEDRRPIYMQDMADEIPSTYVEVSIADQHMWYYVDGELRLEGDTVTGGLHRHDTPEGVYFVSEMVNGKYLTGADYRTWVNKWMRLNWRGIGLHDATWRKSFGGDIYMHDGSHGCVNLPKGVAYHLYDMLQLKDCVIIYDGVKNLDKLAEAEELGETPDWPACKKSKDYESQEDAGNPKGSQKPKEAPVKKQEVNPQPAAPEPVPAPALGITPAPEVMPVPEVQPIPEPIPEPIPTPVPELPVPEMPVPEIQPVPEMPVPELPLPVEPVLPTEPVPVPEG